MYYYNTTLYIYIFYFNLQKKYGIINLVYSWGSSHPVFFRIEIEPAEIYRYAKITQTYDTIEN